MLIHSYATDGFFSFARTLILSFKKRHGESIPFLLHTKDMSEQQLEELDSLYKKLTIKNSTTDWAWLEKNSGIKLNELHTGKRQVEQLGNRYLSEQFYHWKHYISIYSRYRDAIKDAFEFAGDGNTILHLDADLYINNNIETIFNTIKSADVSILLRPSYEPEWRKVYGCILGFTINNRSKQFMEHVRSHIMKPKFKDIPKGYGQTVFWRSYSELKDYKLHGIRFAEIPKTWIYKGFNDRAFILSANNGLRKQDTANRYGRLADNKSVPDVPPKPPKQKPPKPIRRTSVRGTARSPRPGMRVGRRRK